MTTPIVPPRYPEDIDLRQLFASVSSKESRLPCFEDFAVRYLNMRGGENSCTSCGEAERCLYLLRFYADYLTKSPTVCFGEYESYKHKEECEVCSHNLLCSFVVDEQLYRLGPSSASRYPETAETKLPPLEDGLPKPVAHEPISVFSPKPEADPGAKSETTPSPITDEKVGIAATATTSAHLDLATCHEYLFPGDDPKVLATMRNLADKNSAALLGMLEKLSHGLDKLAGDRKPYSEIRHFVCAISLLLNERQHCPPRFRLLRKLPQTRPGRTLSDDEKMLSNDRQVIDLHWLWRTNQGNPKKNWRDVLKTERFNFTLASKFVAKVGSHKNKISELNLLDVEMLQLAALQGDSIRKRWKDIELGADKANPALRAWKDSPRSRNEDTLDELVDQYKVLKIAHPDFAMAARLYDWVRQKKMTVKTLSRRWEKFLELKLVSRS